MVHWLSDVHLMSGIFDFGHLFWKRFDCVSWCAWMWHESAIFCASRVAVDGILTDKTVAFMLCLSNNLSNLSIPTVAPKIPRETLVPFCGLPS